MNPHTYMYADLFAWRGTLLILVLVAAIYAIHSLRQKGEEQQETPEEKEESPTTHCPCCCPCREKACHAFDKKGMLQHERTENQKTHNDEQ